MQDRQISFECSLGRILLTITQPNLAQPLDDYREVNFDLPNQGKTRAVFFLLPDNTSDDPFQPKPTEDWEVPVRWDDNTMLFVPSLDDSTILAAMAHIIENGHADDAFENLSNIG